MKGYIFLDMIKGARNILRSYPNFLTSFDQKMRFNTINSYVKDCSDVLDVGCGPGILGKLLEAENIRVVYLDSDSQITKHLRNRDLIIADGSMMPFKNHAFDISISIDVLEHLPLYKREYLIIELIRVSKKRIIFTFCQLNQKNPRNLGIKIFELPYKILRVPYPRWYHEHNKELIPELDNITSVLCKLGLRPYVKTYQGLISIFVLGLTGGIKSLIELRSSGKKKYASFNNYIREGIKIFLDIFISNTLYHILRNSDIPPYYSLMIVIDR